MQASRLGSAEGRWEDKEICNFVMITFLGLGFHKFD